MSSFNGSGTFSISGVGLPYTSGTTISSAVANQLNTDLATGLSTCILKDGTQSVTANIPFNNYNINNISSVGIGTTAPTYPLHIKSGATDLFFVNSSGVANAASFIPTSSTVPTNGMYLSASNTLAFATNSTIRLSISSSGNVAATGNITSTGNATASAFIPSGSTAPTDGMYLSATNTVSFASNSTLRFSVNTSGTITSGSSSANYFIPTSTTVPTFGIYATASNSFGFSTSSANRLTIGSTGNITPTAGTTSMASGFMCIPSAAGAPTGVPSVGAGFVPMYYDSTNNQFYVYNGAWKKVALT